MALRDILNYFKRVPGAAAQSAAAVKAARAAQAASSERDAPLDVGGGPTPVDLDVGGQPAPSRVGALRAAGNVLSAGGTLALGGELGSRLGAALKEPAERAGITEAVSREFGDTAASGGRRLLRSIPGIGPAFMGAELANPELANRAGEAFKENVADPVASAAAPILERGTSPLAAIPVAPSSATAVAQEAQGLPAGVTEVPDRISTIQTSDVAERERQALANIIAGHAAAGDREGVLRASAGITSPEITAAKARAEGTLKQEQDLARIPRAQRAALRIRASEAQATRESTDAYRAAQLQGQEEDRALRRQTLRATQGEQQLKREESQRGEAAKERDAYSARAKGHRDQLTAEFGGGPEGATRASQAERDISTTLAAAADRVGDVNLSPEAKEFFNAFTKDVGGKRVPKEFGDLNGTELDRMRGAMAFRQGATQAAQAGGLLDPLNWFSGAQGVNSDDLSKFDPKFYKRKGDMIVGFGPAKGVQFHERNIRYFDEQGNPIQVSPLGSAFRSETAASERLQRRVGR